MKASLQSNVLSLEIGASGAYGNTSNFIYGSWNKMPNYALEYVVERDRTSSLRKDQDTSVLPFVPPTVRAASEPAAAVPCPGSSGCRRRSGTR